MAQQWKQVRPTWCKHPDCDFKRRVMDCLCGGQLPEPLPHDRDFNTHRICVSSEIETLGYLVNKADLWWLRWLCDALDGLQLQPSRYALGK